MDDEMMNLLADDEIVRDRLETFAETRLSPSLSATSRMRARVLAVAHRQAAIARADAALTLVPVAGARRDVAHRVPFAPEPPAWRSRDRVSTARRRTAALILAASLALGTFAGTAFAARPGGPLYDARLWAETLTLPTESSSRAVAELQRLRERLLEATAASVAGDQVAATAALIAYERILAEATGAAAATGDDVAAAALQVGVGRNVEVLQGLIATLSDGAGAAISRSIERAIQRSNDAVRSMAGSDPARGGSGSGGGGVDGWPTAGPTRSPKPARATTPVATAKPAATPKPDATPKPTKAPASPMVGGKATPPPGATPRPTPKGPPGP
ncbi:hypothetical protein BH20CHL7_BH20CHL7_08330 [soil metagenome]